MSSLHQYSTLALAKEAAEAGLIPSRTKELRLSGYHAARTGGGSSWFPVNEEPKHNSKFRDGDRWWEMGGDEFSIKDFGAKGDGASPEEDTKAFLDFDAYVRERYTHGYGYISGPVLKVPAGDYRLSVPLDFKSGAYRIVGTGNAVQGAQGSVLTWAPNTRGISINSTWSRGPETQEVSTGRSEGMHLEGLTIVGGGGSTPCTGVTALGRFTMTRCWVKNWSEDGIYIYGNVPNSNSNCWIMDANAVHYNGRDGLAVQGGDSNAGICSWLDSSFNGRWGHREDSFLANLYLGGHYAGNAQFIDSPNTKPASVWYHPKGHEFPSWWYVMRGASEVAGLTEPGSDPNVWGFWDFDTSGAGASYWYPEWKRGESYTEGGPICTGSLVAPNLFLQTYTEGSPALIQASRPAVFLNPQFGTGLAPSSTALVQYYNNFNRTISVGNPHRNTVELGSNNSDGPEILLARFGANSPSGLFRHGEDFRWTYAYADTATTFTISGPNTGFTGYGTVPIPHSFRVRDKLYIGDVNFNAGLTPPPFGNVGDHFFNRAAPTVGGIKYWVCAVGGLDESRPAVWKPAGRWAAGELA
jgi:hypothetical protein